MKKFSIILNIVLLLVSLFFVVYARLQSKEANKQAERANREVQRANKLAQNAVALQDAAEQEAVNAREAEAKALEILIQLEACQQGK